MKIDAIYYIILAFFFIGILLGIATGRAWHKCKPCPEITTGIITLHDTIYTPAPQSTEIEEPKIKHRTKPDTQYTATKDSAGIAHVDQVIDTVHCYTTEKKFTDSAVVSVAACSRGFPAEKPKDLKFTIDYQPPPIHIVEKIRIDTVHDVPPPRFWREVKIAGVSVVIGAAIGAGTLLLVGR